MNDTRCTYITQSFWQLQPFWLTFVFSPDYIKVVFSLEIRLTVS